MCGVAPGSGGRCEGKVILWEGFRKSSPVGQCGGGRGTILGSVKKEPLMQMP